MARYRPCLTCGRAAPGSYCDTCAPEAKRAAGRRRAPRDQSLYGGEWPAIRRAALAAQPWCSVPGCDGTDLTVDHVTAGTLADGVQVLCRGCNAIKGDRPMSLDDIAARRTARLPKIQDRT